MLTWQSIQVVVPAKLQWLSVCPMISQSLEPVIEYGAAVGCWRLRLGRRVLGSPHRVCAIMLPSQSVLPAIYALASSAVIKPRSSHSCTRSLASCLAWQVHVGSKEKVDVC